MKKRLSLILTFLVLWTSPFPGLWAADLEKFLPEGEIGEPEGPPVIANTEADLFAVINGGAERYLRYGFEGAVYQRFTDGKTGGSLSVEIVEMADAAAAENLFKALAGDGGTRVEIGDAAVLHDYYLIFRRGPFYGSVTGTGLDADGTGILIQAAESIIRRMETADP